jgi:hypothetical protein
VRKNPRLSPAPILPRAANPSKFTSAAQIIRVVKKGFSNLPPSPITPLGDLGSVKARMYAWSSQIWYLLKFPPEAPRVWLVETGELFSPDAMRMPEVKPGATFTSTPRRARRRNTSRFWSTFRYFSPDRSTKFTSNGALALMAAKSGNSPPLAFPGGKLMSWNRTRTSPPKVNRSSHFGTTFGAAHPSALAWARTSLRICSVISAFRDSGM